jgi:uncharacterized repeat protein (TIGR02543 family)
MSVSFKKYLCKILIISMVFNLLYFASATFTYAATSYNSNLIVNGNAESGDFTGWSGDVSAPDFTVVFPPDVGYSTSPDGGNVFDYYPLNSIPTPQSVSIHQIIDISDLASDISSGLVEFNLSGYIRRYFATSSAIIRVEQLDGSSNPIIGQSTEISNDAPNASEDWQMKSANHILLHQDTRQLRLTLDATIEDQSSSMDFIEFDGINLQLNKLTPSMTVEGNSTTINSGDITPSLTDHTSFGEATLASATIDRIFRIKSNGDATLSLTGTPMVSITGTHASDFTVIDQPSSSINATDYSDFTVRFDPSDIGVRTATISIANNSSITPYTFSIEGTGLPEALVIASANPADGTVSTVYAGHTFTSTGGTGAKTYAVTAGTLPSGLSLASNGTLTGTPTTDGSYNFTVTVTDSASTPETDSHAYTMDILPEALVIASANPADGTVSTVYAGHTFTSTGGTGAKTYAVTAGTLPSGLSLASNGALTGTPTTDGSYNFTVTVTDSASTPETDSHAYTMDVLPEALVIASANPADGTVSTVYVGHTFTSTGGTGAKTYAVTAGTLPSGLSLASNGTLTGTPTTDGSYNFTVTVTDSASTPETDSHAYTMDILPEALVIASANPADGTVSTVYAGHTFTSTGGTGAKTYAVTAGTLPSGLSLASNGALTGTPTTDGSYNFTVTVTDSASTPETDSHTYTMDILPEGTSVNYLVTYNGNTSNRGSVPIDGNIYQTNDSVTVLGNIGALGKTGHSFAGWNTAADGSGINYSSGNSFVIGSSNVTLYARWTENTSSGGNTSSGRTSTTAQPNQEALIVIVNGQEEKAGKETMTTEAGKSTITVEVDNELIENKINNTIGTANIIQFPIADTKAEVVKVELTGDIVKNLEENTFNVSIKRDNIEYVIPAEEFTISKVAENLGVAETDLETIKIEVKITKLDEEVVEKYNEVAKANGAELIFPPVSFEVVAKTENVDGTIASVNISKFNNYVQRVMEIQEGIDPSKITTGIVFNLDGTYSHVPTEVFQKEGKWYAQLSSLTNSNYSVIWNPVTVNSVEEHWAKEAVNDMASRLIILDQGNFEPNEAITRADFAEYIVRALGIYREEATYENMFLDVRGDGVQTPAILIASENKIVAGYSDGTFRPNELITREEAMTMYHRAMKVTKLVGSDVTRYQNYKDFENVSDWAQGYVKEVIAANVFNGTDATMISPKSNLTYAEAAQAIRNLLVESKLINK